MPSVLPLEGDEEEVKEGNVIKSLNSNKLLIRLAVLLAQVKAKSSSYKLKHEIGKTLKH